jgi:hypothetical protein
MRRRSGLGVIGCVLLLGATPISPAAAPGSTPVRYHAEPILESSSARVLQRRLGAARYLDLLKLNRIDRNHVRLGDTLVAPDSGLQFERLSPFPDRLAGLDSIPKLVLVSRHVQAFAAYERGARVRWGPTSTGRQELPTPVGLLHTNWRSRRRTSTFNDEWVMEWYLNLDNSGGVSMHEYELPGRPASHSCVRLAADDAMWMYGWADTWVLSPNGRQILREGTPVVVFGDWLYGGRQPWKNLPLDPAATRVGSKEIEAALKAYLPGSGRGSGGSGPNATSKRPIATGSSGP